MPTRCCVPNCRSNHCQQFQIEGNVTVFSFPKNAELKTKWLKAINRLDWTPSRTSGVCIKHFHPDQLVHSVHNKYPMYSRLVSSAIPSILPGDPLYIPYRTPPTPKSYQNSYLQYMNMTQNAFPARHYNFLADEISHFVPCKSSTNGQFNTSPLSTSCTQNVDVSKKTKINVVNPRNPNPKTRRQPESQSLSQIKTIELFNLYEKFPCLWDINSEDFNNQQMKMEAKEKLASFMRQYDKNATVQCTMLIIQCYRGDFRKLIFKNDQSVNKESESLSRVWYYEPLLFLRDIEFQLARTTQNAGKNIKNTANSEANSEKFISQVHTQQNVSNTSQTESIEVEFVNLQTEDYLNSGIYDEDQRSGQIEQNNAFVDELFKSSEEALHDSLGILKKANYQNLNNVFSDQTLTKPQAHTIGIKRKQSSDNMKNSSVKQRRFDTEIRGSPRKLRKRRNFRKKLDECELIAMDWSVKLRKLDEHQSLLAESLINKIIKKSLLGQLSKNTRIRDQKIKFEEVNIITITEPHSAEIFYESCSEDSIDLEIV